jgi:hypothetical protein
MITRRLGGKFSACGGEDCPAQYPAGVSDVVISASDSVSAPDAPLGERTKAKPSIGVPYPMPSSGRQK